MHVRRQGAARRRGHTEGPYSSQRSLSRGPGRPKGTRPTSSLRPCHCGSALFAHLRVARWPLGATKVPRAPSAPHTGCERWPTAGTPAMLVGHAVQDHSPTKLALTHHNRPHLRGRVGLLVEGPAAPRGDYPTPALTLRGGESAGAPARLIPVGFGLSMSMSSSDG